MSDTVDIGADQAIRRKRVRELQDALDHAHATLAALGPYEGALRAEVAKLIDSLTVARDATQVLLRHYSILDRAALVVDAVSSVLAGPEDG